MTDKTCLIIMPTLWRKFFSKDVYMLREKASYVDSETAMVSYTETT